MKNLFVSLLCAFSLSLSNANAQHLGVKSNILYDATTTINLGVEFSISKKMSIDLPFNYNPWNFKGGERFKSFGVQPEFRYWFCKKFSGNFIGIHTHYSLFNIGNLPFKMFNKNLKDSRYEGYLYGVGISYGYQWALSKHWGIELTAGLGYARIVYKKYPCGDCGNIIKESFKNYIGPTKLGVTFIYLLK